MVLPEVRHSLELGYPSRGFRTAILPSVAHADARWLILFGDGGATRRRMLGSVKRLNGDCRDGSGRVAANCVLDLARRCAGLLVGESGFGGAVGG